MKKIRQTFKAHITIMNRYISSNLVPYQGSSLANILGYGSMKMAIWFLYKVSVCWESSLAHGTLSCDYILTVYMQLDLQKGTLFTHKI